MTLSLTLTNTLSPVLAGTSGWAPANLANLAHNWHASNGVTESGGKVVSWDDRFASTTLSMDAVANRPFKDTTGGFDIIDLTPDVTIRFLTLDGELNTQPALTALDGTEGFIAISFLTTTESLGGLVSLADSASVLPYYTNNNMYLPSKTTDGITTISPSPLTLNQWAVITLNYTANSQSIRFNGAEILSANAAKSYNFNRFSLNRRISTGVGGFNKVREIIVCDSGISDEDVLKVEAYMTNDIASAP